ncbi:hypothetical protein H2199_001334 [Coniosporium tulheliwenetii]|uniref:Uncharacterized protein n=1 Tax=Coniosporium tulheliwenetii TaxID=3383036 RepID=A0ACC2ZLP9_9PEZI|nr:hypothetical protein H2199_001334 [Cladosporium sp. JES 115]
MRRFFRKLKSIFRLKRRQRPKYITTNDQPHSGPDPAPFRFLDLPAEIRLLIYNAGVSGLIRSSWDKPLLVHDPEDVFNLSSTEAQFMKHVVNSKLTQISRQIRGEILYEIFHGNCWSCLMTPSLNFVFPRIFLFPEAREITRIVVKTSCSRIEQHAALFQILANQDLHAEIRWEFYGYGGHVQWTNGVPTLQWTRISAVRA